jgi:hypothetical protein
VEIDSTPGTGVELQRERDRCNARAAEIDVLAEGCGIEVVVHRGDGELGGEPLTPEETRTRLAAISRGQFDLRLASADEAGALRR